MEQRQQPAALDELEQSQFRSKVKPPHCENCDRETEYLFDGFVSPTNARSKFKLGEAIRLSPKGKMQGFGRERKRRGDIFATAILEAFCKDEEMIRVLWEGNQQPQYYHMDFWQPAKRKAAAVNEPGKVCFQCRPPSNWEIQEILKGAKRI